MNKRLWLYVTLAILAIVFGFLWFLSNQPEAADDRINGPSARTPETSESNVESSVSPGSRADDNNTESAKNGSLSIREWGVEVLVSDEYRGKVVYQLGEAMSDPDGNTIQAAKVMISADTLKGNNCAKIDSAIGPVVDSGAQYIKSDKNKTFNADRYRWTFKKDIFSDNNSNFHLNYLTPDCISSGDTSKIEALQEMLTKLKAAGG